MMPACALRDSGLERATPERALAYFKAGDEETAWEMFRASLPEDLMEKINAIFMTRFSPLPGLYFNPSTTGYKIRFAALPDLLKKQWDLLCGGSEVAKKDELLFKRARVVVIESFLNLRRSSFQKHPKHAELIFSYLDIPDFGQISACASWFKDRLSTPNPGIWRPVASTLHLPQGFWPEYSRKCLRRNFEFLRRVNHTFRSITRSTPSCPFGSYTLKTLIAEYSKLNPGGFNFQTQDTRRSFKEHTLPTIKAICANSPKPGKYFHNFLRSVRLTQIKTLSLIEMFFAAGERGNKHTLNLVCTLGFEDRHDTFPALELITYLGATPLSFDRLILLFSEVPKEKFVSMLNYLLEKGVKATPFSLGYALAKELPLNLLKPLIFKAEAIPTSSHLAVMIRKYSQRHPQAGIVEEIIEAIDIFFKHPEFCREVKLLSSSPNSWGEVFRLAARFKNEALMKRLIQVKIGPNNDESADNTIFRAIAEKASLIEIQLLLGFGAKPSKYAYDLILAYSTNTETQKKLISLLRKG